MPFDDFRKAAEAAEENAGRLAGIETVPHNEKEFSRAFARWIGGAACFVPEERGFRFWDGRHWVRDGDSQRVNRICKQFVDELITYAQGCPGMDENARSALISYANRYNRLNERKRLIEDAKCEITVRRSDFDARDSLLNLENGVLDLETMEFTPSHDPADLITKLAGVRYDPGAACGEWERFIYQSLSGDADTISYLQTVLGLALSCDTSAECMFILLGRTRSGKSTTVETIQRMLNPEDDGYACSCNPETFAIKRFNDASRPSSDIARLAGRRFVTTSEPPKTMLFNVARLKQLTGRDMVTARFLHENEIQFYPKFTLLMAANNAPKVNDMTLFDSDRVYVIPFDNHLEAGERDARLKDRLARPGSLSGILNWCLAGWERFKAEGLRPSDAVLSATAKYRAESDKLLCFMGDCLERGAEWMLPGSEVYRAYREWCSESGYQAEGKQAFFRELRERGLLAAACTVNGETRRNIMPGFRLARGDF